jgi:hypothetical protein
LLFCRRPNGATVVASDARLRRNSRSFKQQRTADYADYAEIQVLAGPLSIFRSEIGKSTFFAMPSAKSAKSAVAFPIVAEWCNGRRQRRTSQAKKAVFEQQ